MQPNPVENVIVGTVAARTALISWTLPQVQGLSSITYFVIIVKETGTTVNFTRQGDNNQYTLGNLKPYRNYTVSVAAGNAYGVGDNVSKRFRTSQAGKVDLLKCIRIANNWGS